VPFAGHARLDFRQRHDGHAVVRAGRGWRQRNENNGGKETGNERYNFHHGLSVCSTSNTQHVEKFPNADFSRAAPQENKTANFKREQAANQSNTTMGFNYNTLTEMPSFPHAAGKKMFDVLRGAIDCPMAGGGRPLDGEGRRYVLVLTRGECANARPR
jgi:hypothetical protein